jgi:hypothetical protein
VIGLSAILQLRVAIYKAIMQLLVRPAAIALSLILACGCTSAALAQGAGHSQGPGGGGPGGAGGPSGGGPAGIGGPGRSGTVDGSGERSPFTFPWDGESEQDQALSAVRDEKALPLDQIVAAARHLTQGQIINAELQTVKGDLLYKLKVLEATGDVREFYFRALSGALVRIQ